MKQNAINLLRSFRHAALIALSPFDYLSRLLNDKADLPPIHLRRYVGPLRSFESSGAEFMGYLQLLAALRPEERVLDIGCGCGQMALYLKDYLNGTGRYVGVDIHQPSIRWCQRKISSQLRNFEFAHIDVVNMAYNPRGSQRAEVFQLPYEERSFDLILLKSVFTHMRPPEVSNYLREVSRLLKSDGGVWRHSFFSTMNRRGSRAKEEMPCRLSTEKACGGTGTSIALRVQSLTKRVMYWSCSSNMD